MKNTKWQKNTKVGPKYMGGDSEMVDLLIFWCWQNFSKEVNIYYPSWLLETHQEKQQKWLDQLTKKNSKYEKYLDSSPGLNIGNWPEIFYTVAKIHMDI